MSTEKATEKAVLEENTTSSPRNQEHAVPQEKPNTREKILDSAIQLFAKKGFNGTTTKEIAKGAEVNEALIFRHFSTKRDLFGAIIEKKIDEEPGIEEAIERHRDSKNDELLFKAIANRMFEKCGNDPSFMRLLHFSALEGHELSDMFFDTYVEYINMLLCDYIEIRIKDGAFKDVNALYASQAFIGMVVNHIIVQELFGGKKKFKIDMEELVQTYVTIYLRGIQSNTNHRSKP